jgi:Rad3-related DNA helicase
LILLPHNYLLEEGISKTTGVDLKNAILIFDDAHHIESTAEEGSSITISLEALKEINFQPLKNKFASGLSQANNGMSEEELLGVETVIERMMNRLQTMKDNFEEIFGDGNSYELCCMINFL